MKIGGVVFIVLGLLYSAFINNSIAPDFSILLRFLAAAPSIILVAVGFVMTAHTTTQRSSEEKRVNREARQEFHYYSGIGDTCTIVYNHGKFKVIFDHYDPGNRFAGGGFSVKVPKSLLLQFREKDFQNWISSQVESGYFDYQEPAAEADVIAWVASLPISRRRRQG